MTWLRSLGILLFIAGTIVLGRQVLYRTSGEVLSKEPLSRSQEQAPYVSAPIELEAGQEDVELFLVVSRNIPFEHARPYAPPSFRVFDASDAVVLQGDAPQFIGKSRPSGRTMLFKMGMLSTRTSTSYRITARLEDALVAPPSTEVELEVRKAVRPAKNLTIAGALLFVIGVAVLFVTHPKRRTNS